MMERPGELAGGMTAARIVRAAPGALVSTQFRHWSPLLICLGLAAGALVARLCLQFQVPLPFCLLRKITGIPCPACGSTRSLVAWAHLDPIEAFRLNPAFFLLVGGVIAWAIVHLSDRVLGTRVAEHLRRAWRDRVRTWQWLAVIAINWLYLCLTLPK